jgi:hypothetical protein
VSKMFGEWYQKTNKTADTNKLTLYVSSVLFVFWYHSLNVLDTPHICNSSWLRVKLIVTLLVKKSAFRNPKFRRRIFKFGIRAYPEQDKSSARSVFRIRFNIIFSFLCVLCKLLLFRFRIKYHMTPLPHLTWEVLACDAEEDQFDRSC